MKNIIKALLIIAGTVSLLLGILGIFLPLLPTTPFLLLAAACYMRGSRRLYQWLLSHKHLGGYIANYRSGKGIPLKAKVISITVLWLSILYSIVFVVSVVWLRLLLAAIAIGVSWHIVSLKTTLSHLGKDGDSTGGNER